MLNLLQIFVPSDGGAGARDSGSLSTNLPLRLPSRRSIQLRAKRGLDLVLGTLLLVLALPLMALITLAIRATGPGPALFRQPRVGLHGRDFTIYKFRTMAHGAHLEEERLAEANGDQVFLKLEKDDRVTTLGEFLRKYSLDELPQLINVVKGDMSLVGPRPLLITDLANFPGGTWARRFEALPGITGLWQVSGRSLCSDAERLELDLKYVEDWSPWLDLKILLRTPRAVLTGRGAV